MVVTVDRLLVDGDGRTFVPDLAERSLVEGGKAVQREGLRIRQIEATQAAEDIMTQRWPLMNRSIVHSWNIYIGEALPRQTGTIRTVSSGRGQDQVPYLGSVLTTLQDDLASRQHIG